MRNVGGKGEGLPGLAARVAGCESKGSACVEQWDPPYCGDIGLKIGADGVWSYCDSPIRREALVKLFARVLRREADGRTYLVTPHEKVDVAVEDAPFLAVDMDVRGCGRDQLLIFRTNVDDAVVCGPDHPMHFALEKGSGGFKPYLLVRGRLEALLTRALCYDLAELAVSEMRGGREEAGIWSGGAFFPFATSGR